MKKWIIVAVSILLILIILISTNITYTSELWKLQNNISRNHSRRLTDKYKIPVLMYHHISTDKGKWNESCIPPEKFKEEMLYLKLLGYNTIYFRDYMEHVDKGVPLSDNPIIITFDDGYLSNYQYAYPILQEYDMKAAIFIVGWSVGRKVDKDLITPITEHFTWEQAKEMLESGRIEIQHHTYDLHNLANDKDHGIGVGKLKEEPISAYKKRLENDVIKLSNLIEKNIGSQVYAFSYPYGNYNQVSKEVLRNKNYRFTLTIKHGISDFSKGTNLIKRINMPYEIDSRELITGMQKLQNLEPYTPFATVGNQNERIQKLEKLIKFQKLYNNLINLFKGISEA